MDRSAGRFAPSARRGGNGVDVGQGKPQGFGDFDGGREGGRRGPSPFQRWRFGGRRGNVIDCSHSPGYELIKVMNESSANTLPASKQ